MALLTMLPRVTRRNEFQERLLALSARASPAAIGENPCPTPRFSFVPIGLARLLSEIRHSAKRRIYDASFSELARI